MPELLAAFNSEKDLFIDSTTKLAGEFFKTLPRTFSSFSHFFFSGYLLLETVSDTMDIFGEKMYRLNENNTNKSTHLKGISYAVRTQIEKTSPLENSLYIEDKQAVIQTNMKRNLHGHISAVSNCKIFKHAVLPNKRYFVGQHSFPYGFADDK